MENRWWEYYAVRYFVGTVFGALLIVLLNGEGSPFDGKIALNGDLNGVTFLGVGLVAALGFAFCYVASAPVLVLHATRAHLRWSSMRERPCLSLLLLVGVPGATVYFLWGTLPHWSSLAAVAVIGLQVGVTLLALVTKFSVIDSMYRALAEARSASMRKKDEPLSPGAEYVTSYRHLREHGNAFAIVAFEGVLASALYRLPSVEIALYFLGAWLLPASFAWVVGSVLESRFVARPL